ncbi:MAG: hypothetical protein LBS54_09140 [Dysgonamonadaceae bacterium]|jgi:hypothetical protein|nr:hypothetical protein [Dysgonamonadaceae bacterium]
MYKNKQNALTAKVLSAIPKNIKPTEYLMERLNISKESAYRRLRDEIPFTFEEITKMSHDLNFSVDEIISAGNPSRVSFSVDIGQAKDEFPVFTQTLQEYLDILVIISNAQSTEIIVAMNNVLPFFFTHFNSLFKFSYFKYMQNNTKFPLKHTFSETVVPPEYKEIQRSIKQQIQACTKNVTLIIDSGIIHNLINDVLYFHKRNLISVEDLQVLKNDMIRMIDIVEEMAQTGHFYESVEVQIYLSFVNVDSNSLYLRCDDMEQSSFYIYNLAPVNTSNQSVCTLHRKKIDVLKKYSRLITQSNEIIQSAFFERQRENIRNIEDKNIGVIF